MDDQLDQAALDYHRFPAPGKIAVLPTKAMMNQRDLSLAYSPGVAVPWRIGFGSAVMPSPGVPVSLRSPMMTGGMAILVLFRTREGSRPEVKEAWRWGWNFT